MKYKPEKFRLTAHSNCYTKGIDPGQLVPKVPRGNQNRGNLLGDPHNRHWNNTCPLKNTDNGIEYLLV